MAHFEWLYKCPEKDSDGVALPQQFDKSGSSKQAKKTNIDEVFLK